MIASRRRPVKRASVSADHDDLTGWQRLVRRHKPEGHAAEGNRTDLRLRK